MLRSPRIAYLQSFYLQGFDRWILLLFRRNHGCEHCLEWICDPLADPLLGFRNLYQCAMISLFCRPFFRLCNSLQLPKKHRRFIRIEADSGMLGVRHDLDGLLVRVTIRFVIYLGARSLARHSAIAVSVGRSSEFTSLAQDRVFRPELQVSHRCC